MSNQQGFRSLSTFKKELHRLKSLFATVPSSISIGFDVVDAALTKRLHRYPLPCVVVGRFAVDQTVQGQGIGKVLLAHALKQVSKVAQIIGVNFVVIHAKDQKAMEFYQRFGFISLTTNPLTLLYPVSEIPYFN